MQKFNDFYQELDFLNLVLFWGIVLVIILIILFLIIAIVKSKDRCEDDNNIIDEVDDDIVIKKNDDVEVVNNNNKIFYNENNYVQEEIVIDKEEKEKTEEVKNISLFDGFVREPKEEKNNLYQKNVFRGMSSRYQTSPIGIIREEKKEIDEYEESINSDNKTYLENVYSDLENATVPDKIELTDYEKKQEDDAVISYQELMKKKDSINIDESEDAVISYQELLDRKEKLYNIREEEENQKFLSELKKFRNDL